ncbi:MAG: biopolymer transporter ExbD [Bdellovibrionales bacterium]|nr:biopolymer transporter ExbD [Bdellovibrionales bacterium]
MAVAVGGASGSGRRKSLDAELNLVSFIDLLSMCICFLLMTAVWIEVGSLQVKQSHGTEGPAAVSQSHEVDLAVSSATSLELTIKKGGRAIQKQQLKAGSIEELSHQLSDALAAFVSSPAGKSGPVSAAMITSSASVSYGDLIRVMDALRRNQVVNLGVVPASRDSALAGVNGGGAK